MKNLEIVVEPLTQARQNVDFVHIAIKNAIRMICKKVTRSI